MPKYQKLLLIVVLWLPSVVAHAQGQPASAQKLRVSGPSGQTLQLSRHDLDAMVRESIDTTDDTGNRVTYEGVPLIQIIRRVETSGRRDVRGKQVALYLLVSASDGYRAVFALAEIDPAFTDRRILLVDRRDGKDLDSTEGPFRIVVPGEKRHARWVRNVTSLALKSAQ